MEGHSAPSAKPYADGRSHVAAHHGGPDHDRSR
jgi:hypothetical protein